MSVARKLAAVALAALAWTSLAAAGATPLTPAAGAVVATSHPVFTWSVPEGETTTAVFVTPTRSAPPRNAVDSQIFSNGERRWSPTRPLFAGAYWWTVKTKDAALKELYSAPRAFRVRAAGRITSLRLTRFTDSHNLLTTLKWRTNTKTSAVTLRIRRGSRLLGSTRFTQTSFGVDSEASGIKSWHRPDGVPQGSKLTLTATLQAGSFTRTLTRTVRAP